MVSGLLFRSTVIAFLAFSSAALFFVAQRLVGGLPWSAALLLLVGVLWVALATASIETVWPWGARHGVRLFVSALLVVAVVEGGLRVTDLGRAPGSVSYFVWRPGLVATFHPAAGILPGITHAESRFTVGPDGLRARGRLASDAVRILAVGGSTTEELYVDDPDTWPALTEELLTERLGRPVWVGNAGKSGLESAHHLALIQTLGAELRPDVIVTLLGWNDMSHSLLGVVGSEEPMLQFDSARGGPLFMNGRPQLTGLRTYWGARAVWRILRQRLPGYQPPFTQQEDARSYTPGREARLAAPKTGEMPTQLTSIMAAYAGRLHDMARAARDIGTRLVLVTQPSLVRDGPPGAEADAYAYGGAWIPGSPMYYDASVVARMIRAFNDTTLRVCEEEDLMCLDLAAAIPPDLDHFYDDVHLNTLGSRAAGRAVAEFLSSRVLPPTSR